ncbi:MAG: sensor domain-containing diguanylate cyclase [Deltaproteobacteria bacterium]|nr:sensor domain-containing diguanylate cyclase [Deltaproteobacteria bacterium]
MRINVAQKLILDKILERKRKDEYRPEQLDLKVMLKEILSWANTFVPSESGSILLDDPVLNQNREKSGVLYFVACFGKGSGSLIETTLPIKLGIAGQTYSTGRPYISKKVVEDELFYSDIDKKTNFQTRSIICAPIKIKNSTIGVIELINRLNGIDYDHNDLTLLKIFAEYTSTLVQNSLDAKRFGELSIRDNLTGLFNDRYFYDRLTKDLSRAVRRKSDLSLLFLDLDKFKEVNDAYGHLAGSSVLTEVGGIIYSKLKIKDATAARYGGDEYIVILPDTSIEEAAGYGELVRKSIEEFVFLKRRYPGGDKALKIKGLVTASIGVASLRASIGTGSTVKEIREKIIKQADSAMYESKQSGKNRVTLSTAAMGPSAL